ncbi:hypothetical protein BGZ60DRAFT_422740 [Tricladium varicosporioides]|nr:hypothetical protein BGZ60DRAFT_422740 [Hymenoscyphus varicosporioides]
MNILTSTTRSSNTKHHNGYSLPYPPLLTLWFLVLANFIYSIPDTHGNMQRETFVPVARGKFNGDRDGVRL